MPEPDFHISSSRLDNESAVLSLGGEIDVYTAPQLETGLAAAVHDGAEHVVVDLSGVSFIDSTVLGVLLKHLKRLRAAGGELVVIATDSRVLRAFEITGLDRVFRVERSLDAAVEWLTARRRPVLLAR